MNPKIEEIVEALRCRAHGDACTEECLCFNNKDFDCVSNFTVLTVAADLIEQLQQELIDERYRHDRYADFCVAQGEELSKLKAQQRWITVTERLPELTEDVLAVNTIGSVEKGMYIGDDTWLFEGGALSTPYVRWWKPFPEPPKE